MSIGHEIGEAQDNQSIVIAQIMEGSLSPLANASSNVNDKSDARPNVLDCFICMEAPIDLVASACGHIFCWPCIYSWFEKDQDRSKRPCPVCRHILVRDRDIIPLYGAGAYIGPSNNGRARTGVVTLDIPPRPNNPLLFAGSQRTQNLAHLPSEFVLTINELNDQLIDERIRVHNMRIDQVTLQLQVIDLENRNTEMSSARDRDVVRMQNLQRRNFELFQELQETRESDLEHRYERNQMAEEIVKLKEQLELANSMLLPRYNL
jgi:hypothetical protein